MKQNNLSNLKEVKKHISENNEDFVIVTHKNPDGDAIGSACGLMLLLENMGKKCRILVPDSLPSFLNWIPGAKKIIIVNYAETLAIKTIKSAKVILFLDFNDLERIGKIELQIKKSDAYKIMIDHHPHPQDFTDFALSRTEVSSTSELVYNFISELNLRSFINKNVATALYTGIMTDTGCFSFNSSRRETFDIVAELLEKGIEKDLIYDKVYNNFRVDRMRLMGYCLNEKMVHIPELRTAYIYLTQDELKKFNFKKGDTEGFVNLPLSIGKVCFSALFIEQEEVIKVSFRSKGSFSVNKFAEKHFSGGGHTNASGGESVKNMENTIKDFISLLPLYSDELISSI